jgi:MFS family permease
MTILTTIQSVQDAPSLDNINIVCFDEALRRTKFGKFNYFIIILSGFVLSTVLLETLSISFVLPVAEYDLLMTTEQKGILSSAAFAGIISSSYLSGFLADILGRRSIILWSLLTSFCFTVVSSFVNEFWIFAVVRFLCGFL